MSLFANSVGRLGVLGLVALGLGPLPVYGTGRLVFLFSTEETFVYRNGLHYKGSSSKCNVSSVPSARLRAESYSQISVFRRAFSYRRGHVVYFQRRCASYVGNASGRCLENCDIQMRARTTSCNCALCKWFKSYITKFLF